MSYLSNVIPGGTSPPGNTGTVNCTGTVFIPEYEYSYEYENCIPLVTVQYEYEYENCIPLLMTARTSTSTVPKWPSEACHQRRAMLMDCHLMTPTRILATLLGYH